MTGFFVPLSILTLCIFAGHVGAGVWVCLILRRLRADRHAHPIKCNVQFLPSCLPNIMVQFSSSLLWPRMTFGDLIGVCVCVCVGWDGHLRGLALLFGGVVFLTLDLNVCVCVCHRSQ